MVVAIEGGKSLRSKCFFCSTNIICYKKAIFKNARIITKRSWLVDNLKSCLPSNNLVSELNYDDINT